MLDGANLDERVLKKVVQLLGSYPNVDFLETIDGFQQRPSIDAATLCFTEGRGFVQGVLLGYETIRRFRIIPDRGTSVWDLTLALAGEHFCLSGLYRNASSAIYSEPWEEGSNMSGSAVMKDAPGTQEVSPEDQAMVIGMQSWLSSITIVGEVEGPEIIQRSVPQEPKDPVIQSMDDHTEVTCFGRGILAKFQVKPGKRTMRISPLTRQLNGQLRSNPPDFSIQEEGTAEVVAPRASDDRFLFWTRRVASRLNGLSGRGLVESIQPGIIRRLASPRAGKIEVRGERHQVIVVCYEELAYQELVVGLEAFDGDIDAAADRVRKFLEKNPVPFARKSDSRPAGSKDEDRRAPAEPSAGPSTGDDTRQGSQGGEDDDASTSLTLPDGVKLFDPSEYKALPVISQPVELSAQQADTYRMLLELFPALKEQDLVVDALASWLKDKPGIRKPQDAHNRVQSLVFAKVVIRAERIPGSRSSRFVVRSIQFKDVGSGYIQRGPGETKAPAGPAGKPDDPAASASPSTPPVPPALSGTPEVDGGPKGAVDKMRVGGTEAPVAGPDSPGEPSPASGGSDSGVTGVEDAAVSEALAPAISSDVDEAAVTPQPGSLQWCQQHVAGIRSHAADLRRMGFGLEIRDGKIAFTAPLIPELEDEESDQEDV